MLFILNDAPYGTEKAYNALRLANQILKDSLSENVNFFLLADSVFCGLAGQETPNGYYNIERMLKAIIKKGAKIKACGTCMDARGIREDMFVEGIEKSNLAEFAQMTADAGKVITF